MSWELVWQLAVAFLFWYTLYRVSEKLLDWWDKRDRKRDEDAEL